ncbi:MAG: hypothetical protein DMD61_06985 [Gemmatimonadetes bacterium]|nr:MAG: hypothetical protein DMD61_06985 [Gemmatimonadota bacterium]
MRRARPGARPRAQRRRRCRARPLRGRAALQARGNGRGARRSRARAHRRCRAPRPPAARHLSWPPDPERRARRHPGGGGGGGGGGGRGGTATVNTRHHQAIRDVAPALRATAWAPDGVIEGVERRDASAPWTLAVQWHPEDDPDAAIFASFAEAIP